MVCFSSTPRTSSRLESLPTELQLLIIDVLPYRSTWYLAQTCKYFLYGLSIRPPASFFTNPGPRPIAASLAIDASLSPVQGIAARERARLNFSEASQRQTDLALLDRRQFLQALREEVPGSDVLPFVPDDYEPCFLCSRFRHVSKFGRAQKARSDLDDGIAGGLNVAGKFCLDCGIQKGFYLPGELIKWTYGQECGQEWNQGRKELYFCKVCWELTDAQGCKVCGACEECVVLAETNTMVPIVDGAPNETIGWCCHLSVIEAARAILGLKANAPVDIENMTKMGIS